MPACPNYAPDPRAFENLDLGLVACGATVHALRGDEEALRILLDTLNAQQLQLVAQAALAALGEAVRSTPGAEDIAAGLALGLQNSIYQHAIEGNPS
ncbi:hypothetical protein [Streptomyces sp. NBC_01565]|uniref:hypothetical protein n=1 Tax=Streptomyces sp. NBC_01565 TaxID=2975881 RepID=UPI00224D6636|nr:hypothetical protein [Streptomyces sp. NBC_01565]MCX4541453.1 hypothetical protein [Streptomyces sp. NBC_01565]